MGTPFHSSASDVHHQRTLTALVDVDSGRILTEDEMDAWMIKTFGPPPVSETLE